jgi:hypothetical protein
VYWHEHNFHSFKGFLENAGIKTHLTIHHVHNFMATIPGGHHCPSVQDYDVYFFRRFFMLTLAATLRKVQVI